MSKVNFANWISLFALMTSIIALSWNIIRDLILNRVRIDLSIAFGQSGNISGTGTGLFAEAGSLYDHKFNNPVTHVQITNTGRRPIVISSVGGKYKKGDGLFMAVEGLPKMLQPYEVFSRVSNIDYNFLEKLQKNEIEDLWALDTRGKKWRLANDRWQKLKETANYIHNKKHI